MQLKRLSLVSMKEEENKNGVLVIIVGYPEGPSKPLQGRFADEGIGMDEFSLIITEVRERAFNLL